MMKTPRLVQGLVLSLSVFVGASLGLAQRVAPSIEVTYLANEGFLLQSGDKRIVIDGLFRRGVSPYATLPKEKLEELEASPSVEKVDLVLVTHRHPDHFDPRSVLRHLEHHSGSRVVGPSQVLAGLRSEFESEFPYSARVLGRTPDWKMREQIVEAELPISLLRLRHSSAQHLEVENLGFLVDFGDLRVLHLGDADGTRENFRPHRLSRDRVDLAFVPFWYFLSEEGRGVVRQSIAARLVVLMHIPPREVSSWARKILPENPDVVLFRDPLEKKSFRKGEDGSIAVSTTVK